MVIDMYIERMIKKIISGAAFHTVAVDWDDDTVTVSARPDGDSNYCYSRRFKMTPYNSYLFYRQASGAVTWYNDWLK